MSDAPIEGYRSRSRALERQNRRRARAIVLLVVLSFAALAIWLLPQRPARLPRDVMAVSTPAPPLATRDTIRRGEGVVAALVRIGLARDDAVKVLDASETRATARRDLPVALFADSATAPIREVEIQIADDRSIRVLRVADGTWTASERREVWSTDTVLIRGAVTGTLVETMRRAARGSLGIRGRAEVAYGIAEAFEYKLDVGRDLKPTDSVVALIERRRTAFGAEQVGPLVAGALYHDGAWIRAIRFTPVGGSSAYYDADGRPMRTTFLTAPLEYRRMSSFFGFRVHPILGIARRHAGVDFAADLGTPVRTVGDGVVIKAGWAGGFGKLIEIRHRDGIVTRYGHLRGFAPNVRDGLVVTQGQVVGYVGSTGLSTGPHLHFETLVNGVSREPTRTLREASGVALAGAALTAFAVTRSVVASRLGLISPESRTATASTPAASSAASKPAAVAPAPNVNGGVKK
jgi:murein DD-endopeptidase MepM/ murein hydrolase activator NlpD